MNPSAKLAHNSLNFGQNELIELIEKLVDVGTALFNSQDLDDLLNLILAKSRELTCSDAGSIYLVDRSDGILKLVFEVTQNASQPALSLREFALPMTPNSLAGYVALTGESLNWGDVYNLPADVPYRLDHSFDRDTDYRTRSMLVLPMRNQRQEVIGVLQLINRKIQPDILVTPQNVIQVTQSYSPWEEVLVRAMANQAAISIELNQLQRSVKSLAERQNSKQQSDERFADPMKFSGTDVQLPFHIQGIAQNRRALLLTNLPHGETRALEQPQGIWVLGRDGAIAIPDYRLAPYHAAIQYAPPQGFYLVNLQDPQDPNPPFAEIHINGCPVIGSQLLQDGDRITMGLTQFIFYTSHRTETLDALLPDLLQRLNQVHLR